MVTGTACLFLNQISNLYILRRDANAQGSGRKGTMWSRYFLDPFNCETEDCVHPCVYGLKLSPECDSGAQKTSYSICVMYWGDRSQKMLTGLTLKTL